MTPLDLAEMIDEFIVNNYDKDKVLTIRMIEIATNNHLRILTKNEYNIGQYYLDGYNMGYIELQMVNNKLDYMTFITYNFYDYGKDEFNLKEFLMYFVFNDYWEEIKPLIPYIKERMEFEEL
jgi:hypothetical protein